MFNNEWPAGDVRSVYIRPPINEESLKVKTNWLGALTNTSQQLGEGDRQVTGWKRNKKKTEQNKQNNKEMERLSDGHVRSVRDRAPEWRSVASGRHSHYNAATPSRWHGGCKKKGGKGRQKEEKKGRRRELIRAPIAPSLFIRKRRKKKKNKTEEGDWEV